MNKKELQEIAKDLRACETGLTTGKGSVPFIITIIRQVARKIEDEARPSEDSQEVEAMLDRLAGQRCQSHQTPHPKCDACNLLELAAAYRRLRESREAERAALAWCFDHKGDPYYFNDFQAKNWYRVAELLNRKQEDVPKAPYNIARKEAKQ